MSIGLVATSEDGYEELEKFLVPTSVPSEKRAALLESVYRANDAKVASQVDLVLYESGLACPSEAFPHHRSAPEATVNAIVHAHDDLSLPLARRFPVFRKAVIDHIVQSVARENAVFAVATALPNIVPNLLELPWALGEFASDTLFITANQVRMAFLIAAASGGTVGFQEQKFEILSIAGGGFGWRAIARELVGKIPFGGGLIPKGAVAYAGTFLVGKGLQRYRRANGHLTPPEREAAYREAYERGREVATSLVKNVQ